LEKEIEASKELTKRFGDMVREELSDATAEIDFCIEKALSSLTSDEKIMEKLDELKAIILDTADDCKKAAVMYRQEDERYEANLESAISLRSFIADLDTYSRKPKEQFLDFCEALREMHVKLLRASLIYYVAGHEEGGLIYRTVSDMTGIVLTEKL